MFRQLVIRATSVLSVAALVCMSPVAVAAVGNYRSSPDTEGAWLREYGPMGALVVGVTATFMRFLAMLRPRIEKWLDARIAESDAMRALAINLDKRFADGSAEERRLLREALDEVKAARSGE